MDRYQLADDKRRWLPGFSPSAFIDAQWRPHVVDVARGGRLDRRAYELSAAYELRSALRAGRAAWARSASAGTLPVPFQIAVEAQRDTMTIAPKGELDLATIGQLQRELGRLIDAPPGS